MSRTSTSPATAQSSRAPAYTATFGSSSSASRTFSAGYLVILQLAVHGRQELKGVPGEWQILSVVRNQT